MLKERDVCHLIFIGIGLSLVHHVKTHSWITCTDYLEENGEYWNAELCRAFPRHTSQYTPRTGQFGQDRGYDTNSPPEGRPCKTSRGDPNAYNDQHPGAVYFPGQKVVITHPTKNHVADVGCTNKCIPDNGNFIFASGKNPVVDPTISQFKSNIVADLGTAPFCYEIPDELTRHYPKAGFQNAPKFCENPDKALATNAFIVPDMEPGRYSFLWAWSFNSENDMYTSCWEVDIVSSRSERDNLLRSKGLLTRDPATLGQSMVPPRDSAVPSTEISATEVPAVGNSISTSDRRPVTDYTESTETTKCGYSKASLLQHIEVSSLLCFSVALSCLVTHHCYFSS